MEDRMRRTAGMLGFLFLSSVLLPSAVEHARAQTDRYPAMAPLDEYLMPRDAEIALARSAAPASISDDATVMVLERQGYTTAAQGRNGFVCLVERSWAQQTGTAEFWNPKMVSPNCFNAAAAESIARVYLMKTRLVLAGKSRAEIAQAVAAALDSGQLTATTPGGMCYMMSKQQYLNDQAQAWHPHVMFYGPVGTGKTWGANLPGSPMIAVNDPEGRVTTFMIVVHHWSDGTPAPQ